MLNRDPAQNRTEKKKKRRKKRKEKKENAQQRPCAENIDAWRNGGRREEEEERSGHRAQATRQRKGIPEVEVCMRVLSKSSGIVTGSLIFGFCAGIRTVTAMHSAGRITVVPLNKGSDYVHLAMSARYPRMMLVVRLSVPSFFSIFFFPYV